MTEGLDATFDAVFMVAYHGSIGAEHAILSHTYNPLAVWEPRLKGVAIGESALNALVALHHRVPVALITGDDATAEESQPFLPRLRRSSSSALSPGSPSRGDVPHRRHGRDVDLDPWGRAGRREGRHDHRRRPAAAAPDVRDGHQPDSVDRRTLAAWAKVPIASSRG